MTGNNAKYREAIVILPLDLWFAGDNRFLNPESSYGRILLAPPCRLIGEDKANKKDSKSEEKENKEKDKKDKEEEEDEKNDSESDSETDDDNDELNIGFSRRLQVDNDGENDENQ